MSGTFLFQGHGNLVKNVTRAAQRFKENTHVRELSHKDIVKMLGPHKSTIPSSNLAMASKRSKDLYRDICRLAPFMIRNNGLHDGSVSMTMRKIGDQFREHKDATDVGLIDMLRYKASLELEEVVKGYKSRIHMAEDMVIAWEPEALAEQTDRSTKKIEGSPFLKDFLTE